MNHFIKTTRGHTVVMGQKTFESIGKPLPNRQNIVISDDPNFNHPGVTIYRDMNKLLNDLKHMDVFIIGGKSIYEFFAKFADHIVVSKIKKNYHCNRFLKIDFSPFQIDKTEPHDEFNVEYYSRIK
jgi:dihydrofolate reductase